MSKNMLLHTLCGYWPLDKNQRGLVWQLGTFQIFQFSITTQLIWSRVNETILMPTGFLC